jgi:hypothetical protein
MRFFYAHPSSDPPSIILEDRERLRTLLTERGAGSSIRITLGRKDFESNFRGDWAAWTQSIVSRTHSVTRKPRYEAIVVPGKRCGRATAQVVKAALEAGRPVFLWDREHSLKKVCGVTMVDSDDWATGLSLEVVQ